MALTTDKWVGTASADGGATGANWSREVPTSNSNVVIETTAVPTVTNSSPSDTLTIRIKPGTVLQFDGSVAKGSTVDFLGKTGGELNFFDSQGFGTAIKGFLGAGTLIVDPASHALVASAR
jgi:hypothetical protein